MVCISPVATSIPPSTIARPRRPTITREIFLDANGEADPAKSRDSALAIGVPGTVAGLALAHAKYGSGKFTLAQLIAPAIALAREGIPIEDDIADSLPRSQARLARWPSTAKIFFADGRLLGRGATWSRRDLAETLDRYRAQTGPRAFYEGAIADKIVAAVRAGGGLMTRDDLKHYRRSSTPRYGPLSRLRRLVDAAVLVGRRDPDRNAQHPRRLSRSCEMTGSRLHLMVEAMKLAYADRAAFLGDPASVDAPLARLLSKDYAAKLRARIDPAPRAAGRGTSALRGATVREGDNTTHFSVVDRFGNAVVQHHHAQFQLRRRACRRRHRRSAQQRARRFRRQAGSAQCVRSGRRRGQRPGTGQAAAVIDDAHHRAQERQAVSSSPAHPAAAASSPRCCR